MRRTGEDWVSLVLLDRNDPDASITFSHEPVSRSEDVMLQVGTSFSACILLTMQTSAPNARAADSAPSITDAVVGLLDVRQLDAGNERTSVRLSVVGGANLFSYPDQNRGDYHVGFGTGNDLDGGVMIPAIRNGERLNTSGGNVGGNNGGDRFALVTSNRPEANTQHVVGVQGVPSGSEMNADVASVLFPFDAGFVVGHALNETNNGAISRLVATDGIEIGTTFVDSPASNGRYQLDLTGFGADGSNGVLIAAGGKNEANFALTENNGDGTYTIVCHDKATSGASGENDPVAFVYLPYSTDGLVAGRVAEFDGANPVVLSGTSGFTVSALAAGSVLLQIDGITDGTSGAMLLSPEGGGTRNSDNIIVGEWSGELLGYVVETRDVPGVELQGLGGEPMFSFAFIPVTPGPGIEWRDGSTVFAVLPDTQYYAQDYPPVFYAQTQWIADVAEELNIGLVMHLGDLTNRNSTPQWTVARSAIDRIFPAIPTVLAQGNHDCGPNGNAANRSSLMEEFFPETLLAQQPSFGETFESVANSYSLIEAAGRRWVILSLEWGPRAQAIEWAHGVLSDHSDRLAIVITHAYMHRGDQRMDRLVGEFSGSPYSYGTADLPGGTSDGGDLWRDLVSQHPNTVVVLSGHINGESRVSEATEFGNVVHQMLTDYQSRPEGGEGFLRLIEVAPGSDTIRLRTYSPWQERYFTGPGSHFELELVTAPGYDGRLFAGDYTLDGAVDLEDLNLVLAGFGDGFDLEDLNRVLADFGQPTR